MNCSGNYTGINNTHSKGNWGFFVGEYTRDSYITGNRDCTVVGEYMEVNYVPVWGKLNCHTDLAGSANLEGN